MPVIRNTGEILLLRMPRIIEKRLIGEFKDKNAFTREELFDFFKHFEPDLKESTFGWRIYDLKNKNIIKPVRKGLYIISFKHEYQPEVSPDLLKIAKVLSEKFEETNCCIWETGWLNEFSQHQSGKRILIVEVEKPMEESVFYALRDALQFEIYLKPDEKVIGFYISESRTPAVVKKLITSSPVKSRSNGKITYNTPRLEKILVDLFSDEKLFYFYQGAELAYIYENAIKNYALNYTKLFSYARRREKEQEIRQFMATHMNPLVKRILQ